MPDVNIREFVVSTLKPLLPSDWRWYAYGTNLDTLSTPVAMLRLRSIERNPANPQGSRIAEFTLTIIEPKVDPATREDALDEKLIDLLDAIDEIPQLAWSTAEQGLADAGSHLGFDITLKLPFSKEGN